MRVISRKRLVEFWTEEPRARLPLERWYDIVAKAAWKDTAQVKQAFGVNVDFVQARSGRLLAVIDIGGNKWRLIAAVQFQKVHHSRGRVYVLRVMDHDEYSKMKWLNEL